MSVEIGVKVIPYNHAMRSARQEARLTQAQLAESVGVSTSYINAVERLCRRVNEEVAREIALTLGHSEDYLFPLETRDLHSVKSRSVDFLMNIESLDALPEAELDMLLSPGPGEAFDTNELREAVDEAVSALSTREQAVISRRFGLSGRDRMTLEEVGRELGVTRVRVRQIEDRALRRLRHPRQREKLHMFLRT